MCICIPLCIHSSEISIISFLPRLGYCTLWAKIAGCLLHFLFFWIYAKVWDCCVLTYFSRRRQWHPVLLPGKSHGQRSLVGCSPWGHEELDMTELLHFHFSLSCIGEGNGNLLQCSCLENPRDRGAWWDAIYGVTQSWKQLK